MEASAANRKEANEITKRLEDEFRRDSGGGFEAGFDNDQYKNAGASSNL